MKRITVENFRCFKNQQRVDLAPLTLLVGENSTGKTSFMALIRILWDVAFGQIVPDFKEDPYDLGSFDEIAHHRGAGGSRAEQFEAGFDVEKATRQELKYHFEVTFRKKGTAPIPVSMRLSDGSVWIERVLEGGEKPAFRFGSITEKKRKTISASLSASRRDRFRFERRFLDPIAMLLLMEEAEQSAKGTQDRLTEGEREKIFSLISNFVGGLHGYRLPTSRPDAGAPVRSKPHRTYDPALPKMDSEGKYIPMYLANMHFEGGEEWNDLKSALERFGAAAGLFDEISVRPMGKKASEPFQLRVRKFSGQRKGPHRNLIDVGYGVSQVLPVITKLFHPDAPEMFLMQQPEVHLHPCAQAALGSLFCKVAKPDRQLIVETHSDYILDRVRRDIRDGNSELKPKDVSILFFERCGLDVRIHSIKLDKGGQVVGAPDTYREFFRRETDKMLGLN